MLSSLGMLMSDVAINGKFLSAAPTGVHRVAAELTAALDLTLQTGLLGRSWRILKPRDAVRALPIHNVTEHVVGRLTWQPWEQLDLPRYSRNDLLLNFCNLGPLMHRSSIVMMHDAQAFSTPESYRPAFRNFYQRIQPALGKTSKRILTVSEFSKQELVRFGICPSDKITVIHNGCDHIDRLNPETTVLSRLGLRRGNYVLALANTQKHKNVARLLEAFSARHMHRMRLVLVGSALARDFEVAGSFVPESVVFAGPVSDAELKALYQSALCLAFPSTTEGFGLPPLEAMSVGCPAIVAPNGALPEVCGSAAVYAPANEPATWVAAITRLEEDLAFREALVVAGRQQAQKFTWAKSAASLLEVIEAIQDNRSW